MKAQKGNNFVNIAFGQDTLNTLIIALERAAESVMREPVMGLQHKVVLVRDYWALREVFRVGLETLTQGGYPSSTRQHPVPSDNGGPQEVV